MTQINIEEIKSQLKQIDEKLSPEEKLVLLQELNAALRETNDAAKEFIQHVDTQKSNADTPTQE
jgi:uncharacterized protein YjgD (DUF1641 family)